MIQGPGGALSVLAAELGATASAYSQVSSDVDGNASGLISAIGAAQEAVGDPSAEASVSDLLQAWTGPLAVMGALIDKTGQALAASGGVYTATDNAVARAAG